VLNHLVNPLASREVGLDSRGGYRTCPVPPPELSSGPDFFSLWAVSRGLLPASREPHQTCPVYDLFPDTNRQLSEASNRTSLVTSPDKSRESSPQWLFRGGDYK
jgi:hypothetical protein